MSEIYEVVSSFNTYKFEGFRTPLVTKWLVEELIYRSGKIKASFDLGRTFEVVNVMDGKVKLDDHDYDLKKFVDDMDYSKVYMLAGGKYGAIAFFRGGKYYKLYPVGMYEAPTIEISGIKMHRVVDVTPWEDAESKIKAVNIKRGEHVIDICTGLGYTAIVASNYGGQVISIEKDRNVLDLAKYNPWSRELNKIPIILGDAYEILRDMPPNFYDVAIHDPPRFALAGELYSKEFYQRLYRILRRGGRVFHYTGAPGHKTGKDIVKGVSKRLKEVGFKVRIYRDLMGIYAFKI